MSVLGAEAIVAGYRDRTVLRGCDLALRGGELVAILGPNGAGKSTLLRVLAGLLRPMSGVVRLDGTDLSVLTRAEIARRIAVVPQVFETLFPFTVSEVIALGRTARLGLFGRVTSLDAAAVARALHDLELGALAQRRIDTLSGGERQRAVLAMALAQEAGVLLLDEPTVHLDPAHQIATLELVRRFAVDRGLIVAAVLHDLNLAAALASRVVVVAEGRVLRDGSPREVISDELIRSVFGEGLVVVSGDPPFVHPQAVSRREQPS
jgi:iron complex transport system ATP-binding protein